MGSAEAGHMDNLTVYPWQQILRPATFASDRSTLLYLRWDEIIIPTEIFGWGLKEPPDKFRLQYLLSLQSLLLCRNARLNLRAMRSHRRVRFRFRSPNLFSPTL
jgi:hypothetical protein